MADLIKGQFDPSVGTATTKQDLPIRVSGKGEVVVVNPDGSTIGGGGALQSAGADAESNTTSAQYVSARMQGFNGTTWDRIKAGITAVTSTLTGWLNTLPWAVFHTTPTTRTNGQGGPLEADNAGSLLTRETYAPGYEDNVANVAKVEQRYTSSGAITSDATVKNGAGFLHSITFAPNDSTPIAGHIDVYDNTTGSGTKLFSCEFTTSWFAPFTVILDVSVANGVYADFTTTADVNAFFSIR